ncbi:cation diffusion facilitator family transporter [Anaerococcus cruorum]|uniref:cation diffusion facilitator family transporter n=1 Tax=Anaerococcus sp. WGS1596 TaxID=3366806 RepID=UPI00372CF80A
MKNFEDFRKLDKLQKERENKIIKTSIFGIIGNGVLALLKIFIGMSANSIAILVDAINNLSDAASSIITIVGTKLAGKDPDKDHPFGYGRIEYLSAMIISVIILYVGVSSLVEAGKKIINPTTPSYSYITIVVIILSVIVKLAIAYYFNKVGNEVDSDSLINSGKDAKLDSIVSLSILLAAGLYIWLGISLEAYLGAIISIIIIKSAIDMLNKTISQLLGEKIDPELAKKVIASVEAFPGVEGASALVLNNYGPNDWNGSIDIGVPDDYTAEELDEIIRDIQLDIYYKYQIELTAIGVYPINASDRQIINVKDEIKNIIYSHEYINGLHGLYVDEIDKEIRFDLIISLDAKDRLKVLKEVIEDVKNHFPEYNIEAFPNVDYSVS